MVKQKSSFSDSFWKKKIISASFHHTPNTSQQCNTILIMTKHCLCNFPWNFETSKNVNKLKQWSVSPLFLSYPINSLCQCSSSFDLNCYWFLSRFNIKYCGEICEQKVNKSLSMYLWIVIFPLNFFVCAILKAHSKVRKHA